jgi:hypothetical protein
VSLEVEVGGLDVYRRGELEGCKCSLMHKKLPPMRP